MKIEPTQSFQLIDENDTRILSLPISDCDRIGASWIDLKDLTSFTGNSSSIVEIKTDDSMGASIIEDTILANTSSPPAIITATTSTSMVTNSVVDVAPNSVASSNSTASGGSGSKTKSTVTAATTTSKDTSTSGAMTG